MAHEIPAASEAQVGGTGGYEYICSPVIPDLSLL